MTLHQQVAMHDPEGGITAEVDEGMVETIQILWKGGVHTLASCQGYPNHCHDGETHAYVVVDADHAEKALKLLPHASRCQDWSYPDLALIEWTVD